MSTIYTCYWGDDERTSESRFTPADVAEMVREDRGSLPGPLWGVEARVRGGAMRSDWLRVSEHDSETAALDKALVVSARPSTVAVRVLRYVPTVIEYEIRGAAAEVTS